MYNLKTNRKINGLTLKTFRKNNGLTQGELGEYIGMGKSYISKIEHGKENLPERRLKKILENDKGWDLTPLYSEPDESRNPTADQGKCRDMVPVIPEHLCKEVNFDILKHLMDKKHKFSTTPAVLQFPSTTCYYVVQTVAMYPHLHEGDILALKVLPPSAPIVNGELYAINTSELGLVVRFAYDRGNSLEMRAQQDRFEPFEIKKETIYSIFRIVGLIRSNI